MIMNREILANRYEIQQQLGKKAGRSTFLATDLVTGKSVIVKLLAFGGDFEAEYGLVDSCKVIYKTFDQLARDTRNRLSWYPKIL